MRPADYASLTGRELDRIAINLNPGEWCVEDGRPIATLLGSCVAVCLFDPVLKLAGMNHFLLPNRNGHRHDDSNMTLAGNHAMKMLFAAMLARGARRERLVAKAFGGGDIVASIRMDIGARNAAFAVEWLAGAGIPLLASDFSGAWSRKIIAVPATSDAFCRRVPPAQP